MLLPKRLFLPKKNLCGQFAAIANYSRKSDSKNLGPYKIVGSNNNELVEDVVDTKLGEFINWELFAPRNYRFILPGSLGPAWHEAGSMVPLDMIDTIGSKLEKPYFDMLECEAHECPMLLQKGVLELFPGSVAAVSQQLTVVSLKHKKRPVKKCSDSESESHAKIFIWVAQEICMKLKAAGFWADFINPFSGRPYISPSHVQTLYETDERFRCIGFEIKDHGNCKVIQSFKGKEFIGSLFTNAPASTAFLYDLLNDD